MVSNLASGEVFRIDVHTGDELEELARSFEKMYEEVGDYIRRLSEVTPGKGAPSVSVTTPEIARGSTG